jgi:chemotaxis protein CheD
MPEPWFPSGTVELRPLVTTGLLNGELLGQRRVFLRPGDLLCGREPVQASTLLGSCVAVMLWWPRGRAGAMCHAMLPRRPGAAGLDPGTGLDALDGRYGDQAALWLERQLAVLCPPWAELEVTVAGGARVVGDQTAGIGEANQRWAQDWVSRRGMSLVQQDVGGRVVRRVNFNLADGSVTIAHGGLLATEGDEPWAANVCG